MGSPDKQVVSHVCSVCINASTMSVNERTPLISSKSVSSDDSISRLRNFTDLESGLFREEQHQFSWLLVSALFLFFFTGVGIATYLLFNEGVDYLPEMYKLVPRAKWNATMSTGPLLAINIPSESVFIADTRTEACSNFDSCSMLVQRLQHQAQLNGSADLDYNFMIDNSGHIFEGLGFFNTLQQGARNHLIVALIGDYSTRTPTNDQLISLNILLTFAVDKNVLRPCYRMKVAKEDLNKSPLVRIAAMLQVESFRECLP